MIKLHIGCGKRYFPGWVHIDGGNYSHVNIKTSDLSILPFEPNSVDLIYASHVIEYYDRDEITSVLSEWFLTLKPGGILRLAVPDFETMVRLYLYNDYNIEYFLGPLYGKMKMDDRIIYHKTAYDFMSLKNILYDIGFKDVYKYDWRKTDHAQFDDHSQAYMHPKGDKIKGTLISLNIEAVK